jgi:hypothetical protein
VKWWHSVGSWPIRSKILRLLSFCVFLIGFGAVCDAFHLRGWAAIPPLMVMAAAVAGFIGFEAHLQRRRS